MSLNPSGRRINVFRLGGCFLFKHYLEDELFQEVKDFYDGENYRFEVKEEAWEGVKQGLESFGYRPEVVDSLKRFAVVKEKYTEHPDILFRNSVLKRTIEGYTMFLMKDAASVEQAVGQGAKRLEDSELDSFLEEQS